MSACARLIAWFTVLAAVVSCGCVPAGSDDRTALETAEIGYDEALAEAHTVGLRTPGYEEAAKAYIARESVGQGGQAEQDHH